LGDRGECCAGIRAKEDEREERVATEIIMDAYGAEENKL